MSSQTSSNGVRSLLGRVGAWGAGAGGVMLLVGGCSMDSFFDPSTAGRWEKTPVEMPILDRLASIEDEPIELVEKSKIQPADLLPEIAEYRFAPADQMEVHIRDYFFIGQEDVFPLTVDLRGYIDIPKLPAIRAQGKTKNQLIAAIEQAIRDARYNDNPVVNIQGESSRKQTFSVLGAVQNPGAYFIPASDYRLLEGITVSGGMDETVKSIYVIRQVPLTDTAAGMASENAPSSQARDEWGRAKPDAEQPAKPPKSGEDLINLINELSGPKEEPGKPAQPPPSTPERPSPGVMGTRDEPSTPQKRQPPPIDLPGGVPSARPAERAPMAAEPTVAGASDFMFENGKWVRRSRSRAQSAAEPVMTQRVIEVPVDKLLAGVAEVNIVLRPGDVVRVPGNRSGLVYVTGNVSRPGPYNLPTDGSKLTLQRAIDSAGGYSQIAIPERIDLTRMIGKDRQATIMINGRAIAEQTQPDIFLKADDRINVGTNFWALPLAVIRNGFRASYGYGFILDRNFGTDVFGPEQRQF